MSAGFFLLILKNCQLAEGRGRWRAVCLCESRGPSAKCQAPGQKKEEEQLQPIAGPVSPVSGDV